MNKKFLKLKQEEIDKNFAIFEKKLLKELIKEHRNQYVLMRDGKLIEVYDTVRDAECTGEKFFKDGIYSIQMIDDGSLELGNKLHAMHMGSTQ